MGRRGKTASVVGWGEDPSSRFVGGPLHGLFNQPVGFLRLAPTLGLDPLVGFQILVVFEEMRDLFDQDGPQVPVGPDIGVERVEVVRRHAEDFFVDPAFVFHDRHPDRRERMTTPGSTGI